MACLATPDTAVEVRNCVATEAPEPSLLLALGILPTAAVLRRRKAQ
jgi:hypothetical protein